MNCDSIKFLVKVQSDQSQDGTGNGVGTDVNMNCTGPSKTNRQQQFTK